MKKIILIAMLMVAMLNDKESTTVSNNELVMEYCNVDGMTLMSIEGTKFDEDGDEYTNYIAVDNDDGDVWHCSALSSYIEQEATRN